MGDFSDEMQEAASELITELGEAVVCTRGNSGAYDPSDLSVANSPNVEYAGVGAPTQYGINEIDGINIKIDDTLMFFYSTTEPNVGDQFRFNSIDYNVIRVERVRAQGEDIMYKVQLRI